MNLLRLSFDFSQKMENNITFVNVEIVGSCFQLKKSVSRILPSTKYINVYVEFRHINRRNC